MHPISQGRKTAPATGASLPRWTSFLRFSFAFTWLCALATVALAAQAPKAKSVNELKAFFQQNCIRCHGLDGSARSPDGKKLGGLDFTQATQDFQTLSGPASEREIRTMIRTIRKGIFFGLTMPAWRDQLSHEDATLMVREILLKAEAGKVIEPGPETGLAL
jgi:mono/diheme cytochrome c family protein